MQQGQGWGIWNSVRVGIYALELGLGHLQQGKGQGISLGLGHLGALGHLSQGQGRAFGLVLQHMGQGYSIYLFTLGLGLQHLTGLGLGLILAFGFGLFALLIDLIPTPHESNAHTSQSTDKVRQQENMLNYMCKTHSKNACMRSFGSIYHITNITYHTPCLEILFQAARTSVANLYINAK